MATAGSYPIILAHGICHFGELAYRAVDLDNRADDRFPYFRKVRSTLIAHGFQAYHSHVSWAAGVEQRSRELADELRRITRDFTLWPCVHIIAHSMGGLDARRMIHAGRMHDRVASLSTIGTPHLGSSFADWGVRHLGRVVDFAGKLGLDIAGFRDLTTASCARFNDEAEDYERSNGVLYRTYAGVRSDGGMSKPLRFSHRIVELAEGPNDGLVSLASARWRDDVFVKVIEADHLNEIGWWDVTDRAIQGDLPRFERRMLDFYLEVADRARGDE